MDGRRLSKKQVVLAIAAGFVVLFAVGAVYAALARDTDAVEFRGGHYVDPVPLTRAQVEHDYGAFHRVPGRVDGLRVLAPTRARETGPPRLLFVLDRNGRTGVLYGLAK